MTAVIRCKSALSSCAASTPELAEARRCLKCGLPLTVLLKASQNPVICLAALGAFPSHSGGQLWYKCLSWSSDGEKKAAATPNGWFTKVIIGTHTQQPLLFLARRETVGVFVRDSERLIPPTQTKLSCQSFQDGSEGGKKDGKVFSSAR